VTGRYVDVPSDPANMRRLGLHPDRLREEPGRQARLVDLEQKELDTHPVPTGIQQHHRDPEGNGRSYEEIAAGRAGAAA
jgi:hypothetical protein